MFLSKGKTAANFVLHTAPVSYGFAFNYPSPRRLREIMKLSMVEREMPHVVSEIWDQYHQERQQNVSSVLKTKDHVTIKKKSCKTP